MNFDTDTAQIKRMQSLDGEKSIVDFESRKKLDLVYLLTRTISQSQDFNQTLSLVLQELCQKMGWDFGEAWLLNRAQTHLECSPAWFAKYDTNNLHRQLTEFRQQSETFTFRLGEGLPGKVLETQKPILLSDSSQEPHFLRYDLALKYGLKAAIGVPIIADRQVVTVLVFFMGQAEPRDQRFVVLLSAVAAQLGDLFRRKQIEQEIKEAEVKYRDIYENSICGIFQTTPSGKYLSVNPALAKIYGYDSPSHLMESVVDLGKQLYVQSERREQFINQLKDNDIISDFVSQVYHCSGKKIWISEQARVFRDEQGNVIYYEGMVEDVTYRVEAEQELYTKAYYDPLTQLPNRALFMNQLAENLKRFKNNANDYQFALLFLNLDRFKVINDSLGHSIGDQLLVEIARKLESCVLDQGHIARIGGDEFTVILENIENREKIREIAEKILQEFRRPLKIEGHRVFPSASMGMVLSSQYLQENENELSCITAGGILRDAEIALHQAR